MRSLLFSLFILPLLLAPAAWASCPEHTFTTAEQLKLNASSLMIVTHATSTHDSRFATKRGTDEAIRFARHNGIPLIYLQDGSPQQFYFMEDCTPDYWVYSEGGELSFEVAPAKVYVIGGHLEMCLGTTLNAVLYSWSKQPARDREMTILMDAVYSNGKSVDTSAPYYENFQKIMSVIMYGRPMGEHWPKITLLGTMGIINKEEQQIEYLKSVLPKYAQTLAANYRVELQLNNALPKILQTGQGWRPPTLRFHFVDSAIAPTAPVM